MDILDIIGNNYWIILLVIIFVTIAIALIRNKQPLKKIERPEEKIKHMLQTTGTYSRTSFFNTSVMHSMRREVVLLYDYEVNGEKYVAGYAVPNRVLLNDDFPKKTKIYYDPEDPKRVVFEEDMKRKSGGRYKRIKCTIIGFIAAVIILNLALGAFAVLFALRA